MNNRQTDRQATDKLKKMTIRKPTDEWKNREKDKQTSNRWMEKQREMHKMSNRFSNEFKMKKRLERNSKNI